VTIHDVGDVAGTPYIAMELVEGKSLRSLIGNESVPLATRVRWLIEIARALAAAHEQGLVHRDIKPENVMIRHDGVAKVLDFGIAHRVSEAIAAYERHEAFDAAPESTLTAGGAVMGTPRYMAPEQIRGDAIDARTDQFSWGVVAYELLTGKLPWDLSGGPSSLVVQIVSTDPRPLASATSPIPAALEATVSKALRKSPRERFATMDELASSLEEHATWLRPRLSHADASGPIASEDTVSLADVSSSSADTRRATKSPRRWALAVLSVAGSAAAAALGWFLWHARPPAVAAPSATASPTSTTLTELPAPASGSHQSATEYQVGMQALRDANVLAAIEHLRRAVAIDPGLAAAHLRLSLWEFQPTDERAHLQAATELRGALSERDRLLLDATEPLRLSDPPDFE
jgi:serine/threonine-protein kinase